MKRRLHLSHAHIRKINKILPYVFVGLIFGIVYAFIEKGLLGPLKYYPDTGNPYSFYEDSLSMIVQSVVMGFILGALESFVLDRIFSKKSFGYKFFFKSVIYISAILFFVAFFSVVSASVVQGRPLSDPGVYKNLFAFFSSMGFWSIMLYVGAIFSITLFISEISDHLGPGVLRSFLLGKYHRPREEARIFMFMDIKSSTTLAETLGHVKYFKFLNEYYADVTEAIIETQGEIYQYVGDEIVVSWRLRDGLPDYNCFRCFIRCKYLIQSHQKKYMKDFGMIPEFKAGLHYGMVTTGRIGVVKKEIVFTGDVLNTASRIQSVCNSYEVDNLVSGSLVEKLEYSGEFSFQEIGFTPLRGKEDSVKLYTMKNPVDQETLPLIST